MPTAMFARNTFEMGEAMFHQDVQPDVATHCGNNQYEVME